MTHNISAEWAMKMLALDEDVTPAAGALAARFPVDEDAGSLRIEEIRLVFGRFVNVARRQRGLTIGNLAGNADIDVGELLSIEEDPHYEPKRRCVQGLSKALDLPLAKLMELAGLSVSKKTHCLDQIVRNAARSTPIKELTPDEQTVHDAVVEVLCEKVT